MAPAHGCCWPACRCRPTSARSTPGRSRTTTPPWPNASTWPCCRSCWSRSRWTPTPTSPTTCIRWPRCSHGCVTTCGPRWSRCWIERGAMAVASLAGSRSQPRLTAGEQRVGVDRGALPPALLGSQFEDREVQVRGVVAGIPGAPDMADHLALLHRIALLRPRRVAVQVGVVVGVAAGGVELVDRQPAGLAVEQLLDVAVGDREDRRAARRHDVEGFVAAVVPPGVAEGVLEGVGGNTLDRDDEAGRVGGG